MSAQPALAGAFEKPLSDILDAVSAEIVALARDADHLQVIVGRALPADAQRDHAVMTDVQKLDAMSQRLYGLATFVDRLRRDMPDGWRMDDAPAAALLTLADLARRLTGDGQVCTIPPSDGDCDLF